MSVSLHRQSDPTRGLRARRVPENVLGGISLNNGREGERVQSQPAGYSFVGVGARGSENRWDPGEVRNQAG